METLHRNVLVLLAVLLGSIFEVQCGISGEKEKEGWPVLVIKAFFMHHAKNARIQPNSL